MFPAFKAAAALFSFLGAATNAVPAKFVPIEEGQYRPYQYETLKDMASYDIVRHILNDLAEYGAISGHYFMLTFRTNAEGVDAPAELRASFPEEMTVIIQHKFEGLEVRDDGFSISLSVDDRMQPFTIPYSAVKYLQDPSVNFIVVPCEKCVGFLDKNHIETMK